MSLTVLIEGTEYSVRASRLEEDAERFGLYPNSLVADQEDEALCFVRNSLHSPKELEDRSEFRVALFTHREWPESQVFSLKEGDKSVGLIFSLQALSSGSAILQAKKLWNDFGLLALGKLCAGDSCSPGHIECVRGETYDITELYSDDTVVAIFIAEACGCETGETDEFLTFLFDRIPSFVRFGLYLQLHEDSQRVRQYKSNELLRQIARDNSNLRIRSFSPEFPIGSKKFLNKLLIETDPYEKHPAFRFFLYYQVIESLLQIMFEEYYVEFLRLANVSQSNRATAVKDLVNNLQEALKEKNRLKLLVGENTKLGKEFGNLRDHCSYLLNSLKTPPSPPQNSIEDDSAALSGTKSITTVTPPGTKPQLVEDPATALYDIRNILFHSFISVSSQDELEELADQFSMTICDLALKYKKPAVELSM